MSAALLPASARELAEIIGLAATLRLVEAYAGQVLAIPNGRRQRGRQQIEALAEVVGQAAAEKLCRHLAGQRYLSVPKCQAALRAARDARLQARFDELTGAGRHSARAAVSLLVAEFGLVDSSVWRVLKRPTGDAAPLIRPAAGRAAQPDMFAGIDK